MSMEQRPTFLLTPTPILVALWLALGSGQAWAQTGNAQAAQLEPQAAGQPLPAVVSPSKASATQTVKDAGSNSNTQAPTTANATTAATEPPVATEETGGFTPLSRNNAFDLVIEADDPEIKNLVQQHNELQRYQKVSDLDQAELAALFNRSEINIRQILGAEGYFTPTITQRLVDYPEPGKKPALQVNIQTGVRTRVNQLNIGLEGAIKSYAPARRQIQGIQNRWPLRKGDAFTQTAWTDAKASTLRSLQARRFPAAKLANSKAVVDPDTSTADLDIQYNSGPVYRYGDLVVRGNERYDPNIIRRLVQLKKGQDYNLTDMADAQQRLLDAGYYSGALVSVDTSDGVDPDKAPVIAQVQEAKIQRLVAGVGYSTDSGARVSLDHTHNLVPGLGWRALTKVQVDQKLQSFGTTLIAPPDDNLWRWTAGLNASRQLLSDQTSINHQARFGRTKLEKAIDRTWYISYDNSVRRYNDGTRQHAQALSGNFIWTYRQFNSLTLPTTGYGFGVELGAGITTQPVVRPFTRVAGRYLAFLSLDRPFSESLQRALPNRQDVRAVATGNTQALSTQADAEQQPLLLTLAPTQTVRRQNGEIVLRLDAGGVQAKSDAIFPSNLLFLTGGNSTVRGYGYQDIGTTTQNGLTTPGRYMVAGSVEYRKPILQNGRPTTWDAVAYVDAGAVGDTVADLRSLKVGVGVGALWRSPVGPVQMSVARGIQAKKFRLHLNLGFHF